MPLEKYSCDLHHYILLFIESHAYCQMDSQKEHRPLNSAHYGHQGAIIN